VVYVIGVGFFIGQMIYIIRVCLSVRSVVFEQLGDEAEQLLSEEAEESTAGEEDEEEEEEQEEDEDED
jgi:hypothetical protein